MAIRAINTYTQTVTPEIANGLLAFNFDKQRRINNDNVQMLARAMRMGRFTTNTLKFAVLGTERIMTNGQHTLLAVVESGVTIVLPVNDFVVDSQDDVAKLYFHEDTQRRRNFGDSIRAMGLPFELDVSPTDIKRCASALRWIKGNFGVVRPAMNSVTFDDLHEWVPAWIHEAKLINTVISPCDTATRNMILSQAIYSVALVTARYSPERSVEFWRQVAQDDKLERYDPRKTIRNWLIANRRTESRTSLVSNYYTISRGVALAWNAWSEGRTLRYTMVRDQTALLSIAGTPYNGKQSADFLSLSSSPEKTVAVLNNIVLE